VGAVARELELPGQLRSMEVQDWAQYLCGGVNVDDLVSRVALLPQVRQHPGWLLSSWAGLTACTW